MGWKARDFWLGPHRASLFDHNGNAGTTAWLDGRAVRCVYSSPAMKGTSAGTGWNATSLTSAASSVKSVP